MMNRLRANLLKLAVPALVFVVALVVLGVVNRSSTPAASPTGGSPVISPGQSTPEQIKALQDAVREAPDDAGSYALLGDAFLQRARETADPSWYAKSEDAFGQALRRDPRDLTAVNGLGTLALARHDFPAALEHARRARRLEPGLVRPYAALVDALVELGRYEEAGRELQRMIDLKPTLASYARVSYFRELHGDLRGAVEAMSLAVSAGSGTPENSAYVQTLLGNLELNRGRQAPARLAYRTALERLPGYVPAEAGLARVDAARGRLDAAIRRYRPLVNRLPLPEYAIALGEAELAAGRIAEGRRDLELVRAEERLLSASGVNTDVEIALFEADHGRAARGVRVGRRAWGAAPSVRSADALGWALTSAGRAEEGLMWGRRALKLGWRDPVVLYHAGMSASETGRREAARRYLEQSLELNPTFSPYHSPRARRALARVS